MQDVWLQLEVAPDPLADGDEVPAPRLRGAQTLRDWGAAQRQEGPREVCQGVQVGHVSWSHQYCHIVDYLQNHMRRILNAMPLQTAEEGPGQGEGGPVAEHRGPVSPPPQGQLLQGGLLQACGGQQVS